MSVLVVRVFIIKRRNAGDRAVCLDRKARTARDTSHYGSAPPNMCVLALFRTFCRPAERPLAGALSTHSILYARPARPALSARPGSSWQHARTMPTTEGDDDDDLWHSHHRITRDVHG
jgi:hypothetical protein